MIIIRFHFLIIRIPFFHNKIPQYGLFPARLILLQSSKPYCKMIYATLVYIYEAYNIKKNPKKVFSGTEYISDEDTRMYQKVIAVLKYELVLLSYETW